MSNQDWTQQPAEQPKQGMSGTAKVLLIIFGGGGILALLCCGIGGYFAYRTISGAFTTDPVAIQTRTQEIATVQVPAEFKPAMGMNVFGVKMVAFEGTSNGMFMLMEMNVPGADPQQMQAQMKTQMQQQGQEGPNVQIESSTTKSLNVRGKPTDFVFGKGKQEGVEFWQVSGVFEGKSGASVMLMMAVPASEWDEARITTFIESIQ